jgi:hypothetical protein
MSFELQKVTNPSMARHLRCDVPQQFICTEKQKTLLDSNNYCGYLKSGRGSPFELCLTQFPEKSKIYYDDCEFDICSNLGTANEEYAKCRGLLYSVYIA